jgi:glycosyltransferase involved in cell wall biosynthesis/ribosomal protein S27AE
MRGSNKKIICPKCGNSRWKIKAKQKKFQCRKCGYIAGQQDTSGLVSIIIPTHKGRDLSMILEAISKSTYRNVEVIIVSEGKERSAQRNIGIDRARGRYLLFLDSDMVITPTLIGNCMGLIHYCNGIYIPEIIKTKGLFGRIRNWERQFYTGTAVDCVRFVRADKCPKFDESMSGPEDSDWDRKIRKKLVVDDCYYHYEDVNMWRYFRKKYYYSKSMRKFQEKNKNDKVLNFKYRCWTVFTEYGKWKRLFHPFVFGLVFTLFVRGIIYLICKKH